MFVLGDSCRFFKESAAFIRLVAQDRLHHFQLDHGIRIGAHAGIHEQVEDIFEPAGDFVQQIFALAGAIHSPADGHLRILGRQNALRVFNYERRLRHTKGLARLRTVENHVFHLLAAQRAVPLLSQYPTDRIYDIGLAAAVGSNDCRDTAVERKVYLLREGFEPDNFKFG